MGQFDADGLQAVFDSLILNAFSNGPLSASQLQVQAQKALLFLKLIALRKTQSTPDTLPAVLERLCREGWLHIEHQGSDVPDVVVNYWLTEMGERRLDEERKRREAMVSQFVEDSELDKSFRRFLDRWGPFGLS